MGKFNNFVKSNNNYVLHTLEEILRWIDNKKNNTKVVINEISLEECNPWFLDKTTGFIHNTKNTFFEIRGIESIKNSFHIEQPIIVQDEIGFLGIVCKQINGNWHFLMQAKIEPGNINCVQISPTIQATKSNFTKAHGGRTPKHLDLFLHMNPDNIVVDQIQSEQSSRFYKKRNRNVILSTDEFIEEDDDFRWMTLKQIVDLLHYDNLVNMDTRTVLSCIPYVLFGDENNDFDDKFINSIKSIDHLSLIKIYTNINDYKMFDETKAFFKPLNELNNWKMERNRFINEYGYSFDLIFCNIEIEGREVNKWNQPLLAANGNALFGLLCCVYNNKIQILVKLKPEIGCFDKIEIGPTIQEEPNYRNEEDEVTKFFHTKIQSKKEIIFDVVLSEEGGRFYHEQNRNVIIMVNKDELEYDDKKYVWCDFGTLNMLTQINNCLNIQLRNMLTMLSLNEITK